MEWSVNTHRFLSSTERFGLVANCTDQTQKHRKLQKYISPTVSFRTKEGSGRTSVRLAASSDPIMLFRLASPTIFRTAESRTFIVEGESASMPTRHSINKDREGGRLGQKTSRSASAFATRRPARRDSTT